MRGHRKLVDSRLLTGTQCLRMPVDLPVEFDVTAVKLLVKGVIPRLWYENPLASVERRAALFQRRKSPGTDRSNHRRAQNRGFGHPRSFDGAPGDIRHQLRQEIDLGGATFPDGRDCRFARRRVNALNRYLDVAFRE